MPRPKKKETRIKFPPVRDIQVDVDSSVSDVLSEMGSSGGFQARYLAESIDILETMCRNSDCVKFLSFPAAIISTGTRGVIKELVKRKLCDVIITTCGTLDHDIARVYKPYLSGGEFAMDDILLEKKGYHRLGNILIPIDNYGPLVEKKVQKVLSDMHSKGEKEPSTQTPLQEVGRIPFE